MTAPWGKWTNGYVRARSRHDAVFSSTFRSGGENGFGQFGVPFGVEECFADPSEHGAIGGVNRRNGG